MTTTTQEAACLSSPQTAALNIETLPFAEIPSLAKLFLDFERDAVALRRFYPNAVNRHHDIAAYAATVLKTATADRRAVCDALGRLNASWGASEVTLNNIARLRSAACVAVVTGQQAGLFTGPLYTIYKALSAVKLAQCLTARGIEAVPVFWIATEDHDWLEVRTTEVTGCDGRLATIELPLELHTEGAPVGMVKLDERIEATNARLLDVLPTTEFTPQVAALIRDSYTSGITFGDGFARLMTNLTKRHGLIFLDPLDRKLKQLAAPVYAQAARQAAEIAQALETRSRQLTDEGYHAQVVVTEDSFPLFVHTNDGTHDLTDVALDSNADDKREAQSFARRAITRTRDGRYTVKGIAETNAEAATRTAEEWAQLIEAYPARFSPNVTLRAVVQDYLLPTVAYFGGAAEIAYFAQTAEVYRLLNRPATPILHRASLTIIEPRTGRTLERYDLKLQDFFQGLDVLSKRIVNEYLNASGAKAFAEAEAALTQSFDNLREELRRVDSTLVDAMETRQSKIKYQLDALRQRFTRAQLQRDRAAHRQLERAAVALYPENALQERHLNITSLIARHGTYCLDWIYDAIDLSVMEHLIVKL